MIMKSEQSSHYYHRDGRPCYQVTYADGHGMRNTTKSDARKMDLVSSVTTICKVINRPDLNRYKAEQYVVAARTLPKLPDEFEDAFIQRVIKDAHTHSQNAAEVGSAIHDAIAQWLMYPKAHGPDYWEHTQRFGKWFREHVCTADKVHVEETFASKDLGGYGGRVDMWGRLLTGDLFVADIKTQVVPTVTPKTKPPYRKVKYYKEWPIQLAAYGRAVHGEKPHQLINLVLDREDATFLEAKTWDYSSRYWNAFKDTFRLWRYMEDF